MSDSCSSNMSLFGWDLTLHSVKKDIKTKEDMLAVIIHWCLVKAGFLCIGVGESMEECDSDSPSEILPEGWNFTENYALRYTYDNKLYNLSINKSGTNIVFVNIIHKGQNYALDVKLNDVIKQLDGQLKDILPNHNEFLRRVQCELVDKLIEKAIPITNSSSDSTRKEIRGVDDQRSRPSYPSYVPRPSQQPWLDPLADPRQVGRADLDPFGRGGGMIFAPPPNRPGVAQGSVPPNARFDPFRPDGINPDPLPRRPPSSDHFPPPGYDDMFM